MMAKAVDHSYQIHYQVLHIQNLSEFPGGTRNEIHDNNAEVSNAADKVAAAILEICTYAGDRKCKPLLEKFGKWKGRCNSDIQKSRAMADVVA